MNQKTLEFQENDLIVGDEIFVDEDGTIEVVLETYFDVDKKFNLQTREDPDTWVNLYARYNPETNQFSMLYFVDEPDKSTEFSYQPSENEKKLIFSMIQKKVRYLYACSLEEFVKETLAV